MDASLRGLRRGGATRGRPPINSNFLHLSLHFDRWLQYTCPPGGIPPLRRRVVHAKGGTLTEVWGLPEKARRVLQATAVEAYGRPGMYVVMAQVMRRANISDPEEFRAIAEYLEERGWIAEADPDYGVFVLTPEGIDEATN